MGAVKGPGAVDTGPGVGGPSLAHSDALRSGRPHGVAEGVESQCFQLHICALVPTRC